MSISDEVVCIDLPFFFFMQQIGTYEFAVCNGNLFSVDALGVWSAGKPVENHLCICTSLA